MCNQVEITRMESHQNVALAIFKCRPNSHPFGERVIMVNEAVKIGRSVARTKPAENNAIFDCKVLSRNHALLWFDNDKFYLQDTKSSNGTFINNQRLSRNSEESVAREICSGDIIQFGVDVVENQRKMTHSCIVASVHLYLPDGREAKKSSQDAPSAQLPCQELYALQLVIQEAIHREQMLEQKLATLSRLVASSQEASDSGWQALIDEDRLLAKLELLECQLASMSSDTTEGVEGSGEIKFRQEIQALQEDKLHYEDKAKESLHKTLNEKVEAVHRLRELEQTYSSTEDECCHLREMCERSERELSELALKYQQEQRRISELTDNLQKAEKAATEVKEHTENERDELRIELQEMRKQEESLKAKMESLKEDADFTKQQLSKMREYVDSTQKNVKTDREGGEYDGDNEKKEDVPQIQSINGDDNQTMLKEQLKLTQDQIQIFKVKLKEKNEILENNERKVDELKNQLEKVKVESNKNRNSMSFFQERLKNSDIQMQQVVENLVYNMRLQIKESHNQQEESEALVRTLKGCIEELEGEISSDNVASGDSTLVTTLTTTQQLNNHNGENEIGLKLDNDEERSKRLESEMTRYRDEVEVANKLARDQGDEVRRLRLELNTLTTSLHTKEDELNNLQGDMRQSEQQIKQTKRENSKLKEKLAGIQNTKTTAGSISENGPIMEAQMLKEECNKLRSEVSVVEAALQQSKLENEQLEEECRRVAESSKHYLSAGSNDSSSNYNVQVRSWKIQLNEARQQAEDSNRLVKELEEERSSLISYKERCECQDTELNRINSSLDELSCQYQQLSYQSQVLSYCSAIPILLLLLAVFLAFSPFLSSITATTS